MPNPDSDYSIAQLGAVPDARFDDFTRDDAVRLGEIAVAVTRERGLSLETDVHIGEQLAFRAQLGKTGQQNADVIVGKRLVAKHFKHSSLLARLKKDADPRLAEGLGDEYKFWGGCIPIFVGEDIVATISASGEPDVVDHAVIAEALRRFSADTP
ncbi:heme-binding protein [Subtercola endophyticus]|uniref:heme-binding protein n=1 Tax=Subtercola endophyticus TaxID=2895559 RepID=UPI001E42E75A|nr:heme-binding protein [Subtercola endophyticus]UFS58173.1 heme-binding protein [Subtercola endophyticus]